LKLLVAFTLAAITCCLWASTATAVGPKLTAPTPGLRIVQLREFIAHDNYTLTHQYQDRVANHFGDWQQIVRVRIATEEIQVARVHLAWAKRLLARYWSMLGSVGNWKCIHRFEGSWKDSGDPFWGGLQMDRQFQQTYGTDMLRAYGGYADRWHPYDQMIVAERARRSGRGYYPWPNTARYCGLI
jgi:hypothetical protein